MRSASLPRRESFAFFLLTETSNQPILTSGFQRKQQSFSFQLRRWARLTAPCRIHDAWSRGHVRPPVVVIRLRRRLRHGARTRARDRFPHPRWRCRHVDTVDPERLERVDERIDYRWRRTDRAGFADALDPERIGLAGHFLQFRLHVRHRVGARHAVVHEAAGEQLSGLAIVDLVFQQRLAETLHDPAVNLAANDQRIENAAEVVDDEIAVDHHLAGFRVYLQLADMRAVGMTGRIGAEAATRLETDAELVGEGSHRRIGGLGDVDDGDRLVGADDAILAVLELDIGRVRLHQRGG